MLLRQDHSEGGVGRRGISRSLGCAYRLGRRRVRRLAASPCLWRQLRPQGAQEPDPELPEDQEPQRADLAAPGAGRPVPAAPPDEVAPSSSYSDVKPIKV